MSKNEKWQMKLLVIIAIVLSGFFAGLGTVVTVASWLWVIVALIFLGVAFALLSYGGYLRGRGKIAGEPDLDSDISYRIGDIVKTRGRRLLFLDSSLNYETEIVMEPRDGFKKFEILDDKYLVPKKLKAKIVDGRLWTPVT